VHFTGYLSGLDLAAAYASSDIFVFPAANETLGNVVLEAMASGLPVIAPRSGGVLDSVVDGETGLLFEPESPASLVAMARTLVHAPDVARRLGEYGRARVLHQSWERVLDGLLEHYAALLDGKVDSSRSVFVVRKGQSSTKFQRALPGKTAG